MAHVFRNASTSLTFLQNIATANVTVPYNGNTYALPESSVLVIDATGSELFNTAKVDTDYMPTQRVYTVCANVSKCMNCAHAM